MPSIPYCRLAVLAIVAGLIWAPRPLLAQVVQGQVVDSTAGTPVVNGFVVLLDTLDNEVARSISSDDGRFSLRAPRAGRYRLRSERIGFRAHVSDFLELADGQTVDFSLHVQALPVQLASVVVPGNNRCTSNPEQGANTVVVWEEIRKALAAAVWGEDQELFHYRQYAYRRELNGRRDRTVREEMATRSGVAEPPFRSAPAERLAREGYIVERADGAWYYVPDAHTLLDNQFLATHCFRVERDERNRPGQVALAFEPMGGRDLPDVEGTLWLDESSSELRELEVQHTGVEFNIRDRRIGGTVKFLMLPSGAWIVREWQIRTPLISMTDDPHRIPRHTGRVTGFTDTGGEIYQITSRDGSTIYEAPLATVTGTVFDSTSGSYLGGAFVALAGTDLRARSDSVGRFALRAPFDGEYTLSVDHPRLDSVAVPQLTEGVTLERGSSTKVAFEIPHVRSRLRTLCGSEFESRENRVIVGSVQSAGSGEPMSGVRVSASWQEVQISNQAPVERNTRGEINNSAESWINATVRDMRAETETDDFGVYSICGVPAGRSVRLVGEEGGEKTREASLIFPYRLGRMLLMDWDRVPGDEYANEYAAPLPVWRVDLTLGDPRRKAVAPIGSVLHGTVTDLTTGDPLEGVSISVNGSRSTVTGADGSYQLVDIQWLEQGNRIEYQRLGYAPALLETDVNTPEGELLLNASLARSALEMSSVVVEGERLAGLNSQIAGFLRRVEAGVGDFFTREDIEKFKPMVLSDLLQRVPGLMLDRTDGGQSIRMLRRIGRLNRPSGEGLNRSSMRCEPEIILDGVRLSTVRRVELRHRSLAGVSQGRDIGIDDLVNPGEVIGVEVYNGPSSTPAEFGMINTDCGVIVIWTRRGPEGEG